MCMTIATKSFSLTTDSDSSPDRIRMLIVFTEKEIV